MKVICPGHFCVLETKDKQILEYHQGPVEAVVNACPYCHEELHLLNILLENVSYWPSLVSTNIVAAI